MEDLAKLAPKNIKPVERVSIIHINAQSLSAKLDMLEIEAEEHDIATLSETWLHEDVSNDSILLEGFQPPSRRDRGHNRYGGVAIYCRNNIAYKQRPDLDTDRIESVWIEVIIKNKRILVGKIY